MPALGDLVHKVRSKNAGPFWVTIDIFCGSPEVFETVCDQVETTDVARLLGVDPAEIKRFDIADLRVVKFSLPRPVVQGNRFDRDMHGAQWAVLLSGLQLGKNG